MRSADANNTSPTEAQVLALLDWWVQLKREKIVGLIRELDPNLCAGTKNEQVGLAAMSGWGWREEFAADVAADPFASFIWKAHGHSWTQWLHRSHRTTLLEWEVSGRVGSIAQKMGWTHENLQIIRAAAKRLKIVQKVQES